MNMKIFDVTYYYCPVQNTAFQRFVSFDSDNTIWMLTLIPCEEHQKDKVRVATQTFMRRVDNRSYEIHQYCTNPEIEYEDKRLTHEQAMWWLLSNGFPRKLTPKELNKYYKPKTKYLERSIPDNLY